MRFARLAQFFSPIGVVPSIEVSKLDCVLHDTLKPHLAPCEKHDKDGLYSCYSQLTVTPNNLGLLLEVLGMENRIDLRKHADALGHWPFSQLEKRLAEKHSRTVFVKASKRATKTRTQYRYEKLVYCDRPSIERFVDLVTQRNIVFEFTLSEKPGGSIRNHGYPWRLNRAEFLEHLFSFQIKLR